MRALRRDLAHGLHIRRRSGQLPRVPPCRGLQGRLKFPAAVPLFFDQKIDPRSWSIRQSLALHRCNPSPSTGAMDDADLSLFLERCRERCREQDEARLYVRTANTEALKAFVTARYLSTESDRTLLARMYTLEPRYIIPAQSFTEDCDTAHLLLLAIQANDLERLLAFVAELERVEKLSDMYEDEEEDFLLHDNLEVMIVISPELRIAFPDMSAHVSGWASKHAPYVCLLDGLRLAKERNLVPRLSPRFFDEVEASVMSRKPKLYDGDRDEHLKNHDALETLQEVELVLEFFTDPRRMAMIDAILLTSGNPTCRILGSFSQTGMALNLREAIVGLAGGLV